jgi:hypothetical protein
MKKLSVLFLSVTVVFSLSCRKVTGDGPTITENRAINNFTSVASSISADVFYRQEPQFKVEITAQQNILDVIETHVVNNELVIKFRHGVLVRRHENIIVNVSSPVTNGLRISGSGNIVVADSVNAVNINLSISGSGSINVHKLTATSVDAGISGSGNITISSGAVNTAKLKISGSGNIDMMNVSAASVNTATSGSGDMRVNATQNLDVSISGSGSVSYTGNPVVNTHISGSGRVVHQ